MANFTVSLKKLTEKVSMDVVYAPQDLENISVEIAEVNRPGLFLAGYYDYFDKLRLQIMGLAEMNFLSGLSPEKRYEALDQLFRQQPPAVIVGRSEELKPFPEMQELAKKHGVALLRSNETTCTLMGSIISVLNLELAPRITRHGVLVEVYGEGILILGDSGIGKSELAIELVKRGHRLVADDAVELRKVSNRQIMGTAPENIRHFIELRGIGIVNVARVFGVGAVKVSESLDLVVQLEAWDPTKNYQRTGTRSWASTSPAPASRSRRDATSPLCWKRQPSTTARRRWATTPPRSCSSVWASKAPSNKILIRKGTKRLWND